jgi:hypothetical protein
MPQPNTLLELIDLAPAENSAFLLTDSGIRVSYESLRKQVTAMADALASMGIGREDRVATVLPNGLPAVVSFLAASILERRPLNPGYREDEFSFSGGHECRVSLPKARMPPARPRGTWRSGLHLQMDARGGSPSRCASGKTASPPTGDDTALVLHQRKPGAPGADTAPEPAYPHDIVAHYGLSRGMSRCASCRCSVHGWWLPRSQRSGPAAPCRAE